MKTSVNLSYQVTNSHFITWRSVIPYYGCFQLGTSHIEGLNVLVPKWKGMKHTWVSQSGKYPVKYSLDMMYWW
jgi:hypothetical protein